MNGKIPIWFDNRFGMVEQSKRIKLCPYVVRVSTLRRGVKLTIPLNPAKFYLDMLNQGTMKSFQLVKRGAKYYVHVKMECHVPDQPIHALIDQIWIISPGLMSGFKIQYHFPERVRTLLDPRARNFSFSSVNLFCIKPSS
jgi:hypothetical protein